MNNSFLLPNNEGEGSSKQPKPSEVRPFPPSTGKGDPVWRGPCLCLPWLPLVRAFNEAVALLFNCAWYLERLSLAKESLINTAQKSTELLYKMFMDKSKKRIKSSICSPKMN